jgi:hypothetical protein
MRASEFINELTKPYQQPPTGGDPEFVKSSNTFYNYINVAKNAFNKNLIALKKNNPDEYLAYTDSPDFIDKFKDYLKNYLKQKSSGFLTDKDYEDVFAPALVIPKRQPKQQMGKKPLATGQKRNIWQKNPDPQELQAKQAELKAKLGARNAERKTGDLAKDTGFGSYASKNKSLNADIYSESSKLFDEDDYSTNPPDDIPDIQASAKPTPKISGEIAFDPDGGIVISDNLIKKIANSVTERWYKNRQTAYTSPETWAKISGNSYDNSTVGNSEQQKILRIITGVDPRDPNFGQTLSNIISDPTKSAQFKNEIYRKIPPVKKPS